MKKKVIKKVVFIIILLLIVGIFLTVRFKSYDYEVNYVVNKYKILEKYNNKKSEYTFIINNSEVIIPYNFENEYIRKKELIENIKIYNDKEKFCILPISNKINFYPICYNEENLTFYNLSDIKIDDFKYQKVEKEIFNNKKINVNYTNNNKYLIYNYKGFYYIKDNKIEEIKLFNKDIYSIDLIYQLNQYLVIPNYNKDYYFNKFYIININNGKVKELELDKEISFDSIFLGDYKNKIYLLDKKEEKEYRLSINKLKVEEIDFTLLKNNNLEKITFKEIVNNNLLFDNQNKINYEIKDNKLYHMIDNYRILVTDKNVDKIIKEEDNTIYYLSKENLYMYNNNYGEVLLISNFEWNFNNTNTIYFYK